MTARRLIKAAFPLKQVSLDSVHEKNVRHVPTLHTWPARRLLAASRTALLATLLPDPGDAVERQELLRRMAARFHPLLAFREERTFRGRTPPVLDPFAGGGAIPLEAMRLVR